MAVSASPTNRPTSCGASPGAALALTKMNTEIDIRHVLPTIRVPTLVIHREGDPLFDVEEGRYGQRLHFWSLDHRELEQTIDLGADGLVPLEIRLRHDPDADEGFVGAALSSTVWRFHRVNGAYAAERVIAVDPVELDTWPIPVPGLITDLESLPGDVFIVGDFNATRDELTDLIDAAGDVQFENAYDGFSLFHPFWVEGFGFFGVKEGGSIEGALQAPLRPQVPALAPGKSYLLEAVVRTVKIGHPFTQGTVDSNEVWLDVRASSGGRVIGRSGGLGGADAVDPWAHFANVYMLDREGNRFDHAGRRFTRNHCEGPPRDEPWKLSTPEPRLPTAPAPPRCRPRRGRSPA